MDKEYSISTLGKLGQCLIPLLLSTGAVFTWFVVIVGVIHEDISNPKWWLYTTIMAVLALLLTFWSAVTWKTWRKTMKGIIVREKCLSIYGEEVAWEDIRELFTNPEGEFVSILLSGPYDEMQVRHIYKVDIPSLDRFVSDIKKSGVIVREEAYEEDMYDSQHDSP